MYLAEYYGGVLETEDTGLHMRPVGSLCRRLSALCGIVIGVRVRAASRRSASRRSVSLAYATVAAAVIGAYVARCRLDSPE